MSKTNKKIAYYVQIISPSKSDIRIKHTFKKFDRSIKRIKSLIIQKTVAKNHGEESVKYIHNFVVYTKPRAEFPKVWYGLINNNKLIKNLEIKLISGYDNY